MKIILDETDEYPIEVTEYLEPTYVTYSISKGNSVINLDEYELKELIKVLQFYNDSN